MALAPATGTFAPENLAETLEDLSGDHERITLIQVPAGHLPHLRTATIVSLTGPNDPIPDRDNGLTVQPPGHTIRAWVPDGSERPDRNGVLGVPALCPADEETLRSGLLPASTAAGRALGWAARDLAGLKVGFAFGGGSIKGFAHVGVLRVLERLGLRADYVAGTSIGASVAAVYAMGYGPDEIAEKMELVGSAAFRLHLSTSALLSNSGLRDGLRAIGGTMRIEDMRVPLAVTAADIFTRQEVVFRSGLAWPAVLASMSIPGIYPAVRLGHHTLVDGGVLNPVPSNVAAAMGADTVIAIKLGSSPEQAGVLAEADEFGPGRVPSVVQVIARSVEIMQTKISTDTAAAATILITPEFPETPTGWAGLRRFGEGRRFIELGEAAAEAALPRISANVPWIAP
jgi:NTE family protein